MIWTHWLRMRYVAYKNRTYLLEMNGTYRVSGKKLTEEIVNKILAYSRITAISTWHHPKAWSNIQ